MECQKHLFSIRPGIHYLNCAYKGPLMKSAEEASMTALIRERNPVDISTPDFFDMPSKVRIAFGQLVHCRPANVAIMPSTSYGFSTALNNIAGKPQGHAITILDEFPSGYFSLQRWCATNAQELVIISPNPDEAHPGKSWNENILGAINDDTSVVLMSSVHWMSGVKYDLQRIGEKCKEVGAKLIVDGTQSVGAMPIDVQKCKIDALVCATYKWLLGPYSTCLAYMGDSFDGGVPLEEAWVNRTNATDFTSLTQYDDQYLPHAGRYNVGQSSHFVLMPSLLASLHQLLAWDPANIQQYCEHLALPLKHYLEQIGVSFDEDSYRSHHLFSLRLPEDMDIVECKDRLLENNIYISVRGSSIRISINVFNDSDDIAALIRVIRSLRTK